MLVGFWSVAAAVGLYSFSIVILLLVCCSKNVSVRSKIILLSAEKRLRRHSEPPHAFGQGMSEGGPETQEFIQRVTATASFRRLFATTARWVARVGRGK